MVLKYIGEEWVRSKNQFPDNDTIWIEMSMGYLVLCKVEQNIDTGEIVKTPLTLEELDIEK